MNISLRPPEQICVGQHSPIRVPRFPVLGNPQEILTSGTSYPCFANTGVALLMASSSQFCLLNGFDDIGLTLRHADKIKAYEAARLATKPWLAHTAVNA